ncbi:hypothetical protein HS1genome_0960 [Sulfodiicoccus acidiphilus]|uniref:GINS subunit domain-containing protein n=1 Tax=Sulfodiicoccus acidiphilus TaxID=1670455 RepID=A0A348B319_9CREN|nr:hypothetical protein HS1genome_0960 [Sulfodiicoccus acidiphilus]
MSLQRGKEGEVPRWLTGVTQILKPTQRLTLQELNRVLFQETQSASKPASLVPLHRDFYARVRELLNELKGQPDVSKKAESVARELVTLRLRKIMNLAFLGVQDPSIVQGMTDEELLLFSEIRELVNLYYGELIGERA